MDADAQFISQQRGRRALVEALFNDSQDVARGLYLGWKLQRWLCEVSDHSESEEYSLREIAREVLEPLEFAFQHPEKVKWTPEYSGLVVCSLGSAA